MKLKKDEQNEEIYFYCVACKEKVATDQYIIKVSDSGRQMAQGICPVDGKTKINRILGKVDHLDRPAASAYSYTEYVTQATHPVYSQESGVVEAGEYDPELRMSGYMTLDEFVDDLSRGLSEYFKATWPTDEDNIYHPEDLIYHADAFIDSLAIGFSIFGAKARP